MKKKVIIISLALMLLAVGVVSAAANWGKFEGYNIVKLVIDGKEVVPKDTPPVILKGRTMVPLAMLEQAGVKATWDASTYTVDVKSSEPVMSNSEINIRNYFAVLDFYKSIDDVGEKLVSMGSSLNTAYNGIVKFGSRESLDNNYTYMEGSVETYNYFVDTFNDSQEYLEEIGVDISNISNAFKYYFDAIDHYNKSFEYLEVLYTSPNNNVAYNSFFDELELGSDKSFRGSNIGIDGYYKYRELILQQ